MDAHNWPSPRRICTRAENGNCFADQPNNGLSTRMLLLLTHAFSKLCASSLLNQCNRCFYRLQALAEKYFNNEHHSTHDWMIQAPRKLQAAKRIVTYISVTVGPPPFNLKFSSRPPRLSQATLCYHSRAPLNCPSVSICMPCFTLYLPGVTSNCSHVSLASIRARE